VELPLQDMRMRVFNGLTKHPSDTPMVLSVLQRKGRSGRKTQKEMLSTKPRRWEMPPNPSSSGLLEANRAAAHSLWRESIGWRRWATTKEAKRGNSGQP
jgi:hypothetical protein